MLLNSGTGLKEVFYSGSIHANEWITSLLLMKFIENYCISYNNNSKLYGYSVRELFNNVSIYIMPMVNPDGVDLVTGNISKTSSAFLTARNISNNFSDIPSCPESVNHFCVSSPVSQPDLSLPQLLFLCAANKGKCANRKKQFPSEIF